LSVTVSHQTDFEHVASAFADDDMESVMLNVFVQFFSENFGIMEHM